MLSSKIKFNLLVWQVANKLISSYPDVCPFARKYQNSMLETELKPAHTDAARRTNAPGAPDLDFSPLPVSAPEAAPKYYHVATWGCQMNEEDSEQISLYLEELGYTAVGDYASADIVMLNTCSVRQKPEEKVWSELGRLRDLKLVKPDLIVGVCGCMAQSEYTEIQRRAPHVNLIVGTGNIAAIPEMIAQIKDADTGSPSSILTALPRKSSGNLVPLTSLTLPPRRGVIVSEIPARKTERAASLKAHVPIMYGCDKFCTFCIVPLTRGRERSRPTVDILAEIEGMARNGTKEVCLLGQTVNSYGKNLPEGRVPFARLLEEISQIRGIQRIRFTSPYPRDFTDELIETIAKLDKVCEQVHLPLQVADDELLAEMHRGYTVADFRTIVEKLRAQVSGIAISTDIMLGYPGETDDQYQNTMRFVEETQFDSAFMFAYSPRTNTKAALKTNQVPKPVKVDRLNRLVELQNSITISKNKAQIGNVVEVLVEGRSQKDDNRLSGYTRTLKMTHFTVPEGGTRSLDSLIGKTVPVFVEGANLTSFYGVLAEPTPYL